MRIQKIWLVMGILLIVLGFITLLSSTIFEAYVAFSEYGGVIIESEEEVRISHISIARAGSDIPPNGTSLDSPITMSSAPLPLASMSISKGNWYCRVDIYSIKGKTPANRVFKVELYRWNSVYYDYDLVGTLYIKSTSSPTDKEGVRLYFDLGPSRPESTEAFMVVISKV